MADLGQLQAKYAPVIETIQSFGAFGAKVDTVELAGDKLHLKAEVPSNVIANRVWDAIKAVDPSFSDLDHEIVTTGPDAQPYTIQAGDNLSKVSKLFYGSPNHYPQIAEANGLSNPDMIHPGQTIQVPPLG